MEATHWQYDASVVGNLNIDLILHGVAAIPEWGHEVTASGRTAVSSGQAGLLALALGALDVSTCVVANVGGDDAGAQILDDLQAAGVRTADVELTDEATGLTVALVRPDGERAFVTDFGSLASLTERTIRRHNAVLAASKAVCFVGLFMLPRLPVSAITALAHEARERAQTTLVDPGWDPGEWSDGTLAAMRDLLAHTDILLVNSEEASALTGLADHERAAATLHEAGARTVVVKRGGAGAHARRGSTVCDVGALPVEVHDTVGAGDTFNAGFLAAYLRGGSLAAAMELGSAVAAIYCSRARSRFPSLEEAQRGALSLTATERAAKVGATSPEPGRRAR